MKPPPHSLHLLEPCQELLRQLLLPGFTSRGVPGAAPLQLGQLLLPRRHPHQPLRPGGGSRGVGTPDPPPKLTPKSPTPDLKSSSCREISGSWKFWMSCRNRRWVSSDSSSGRVRSEGGQAVETPPHFVTPRFWDPQSSPGSGSSGRFRPRVRFRWSFRQGWGRGGWGPPKTGGCRGGRLGVTVSLTQLKLDVMWDGHPQELSEGGGHQDWEERSRGGEGSRGVWGGLSPPPCPGTSGRIPGIASCPPWGSSSAACPRAGSKAGGEMG